MPVLDHTVHAETVQILDQNDVGAVARGKRSAVVEAVMPGGNKRSVPECNGRRHSPGNHAAEKAVEMTVSPQVAGKNIVGHQAPRLIQLATGQQRQQRIEISGTRAVAHLDEHAQRRAARASSTVVDS